MKHGSKRITLYQKNPSITFFMLMLAITTIVIEIFFIDYMTNHGLENRMWWITLSNWKFGIPILYLPIFGIVVVLLSSWKSIIERQHLKKVRVWKLRNSSPFFNMFNSSIFLLFVLCIFLFLPCILSSNWSLRKLIANEIPLVRAFSLTFYELFFSFMDMPVIWKFTLLQSSACLALALFSLFICVKTNRGTLEKRF